MIRIYADDNNRDEKDRYVLNIRGSLRDIGKNRGAIRDGLVVILNVQNEFEVSATLTFDGVWRATPDVKSIRYFTPEDNAP